MKRFLAVLLCMVMVSSMVSALGEVDLSGYSTEELYALQRQVGQEILSRVMPDGVYYEDDEVKVQWIGLTDNSGLFFSPNVMITNKSDNDIYFDIATLAVNGIKTHVYSSMFGTTKIEPGLALMTGPNKIAMVQSDSFAEIGINGIKDIETVYIAIEFYDSKEYNQKVIKEVKQTIPIEK